MRHNYINLTSGIEWVGLVDNPKFVRIQSSQLEATALWSVANEVDYGFLMDAALGSVHLFDAASRGRKESRAVWQGVPWLRYLYAKANNLSVPPTIPTSFIQSFKSVYGYPHKYRGDTKKKFRYVFKMTQALDLNVTGFCMKSALDGNYEALRDRLKTFW